MILKRPFDGTAFSVSEQIKILIQKKRANPEKNRPLLTYEKHLGANYTSV